MEMKETIPEVRIAIMKIEVNILNEVENRLIAMNEVEPIDFDFIRCIFAEYISGREYEIKELQKQNK